MTAHALAALLQLCYCGSHSVTSSRFSASGERVCIEPMTFSELWFASRKFGWVAWSAAQRSSRLVARTGAQGGWFTPNGRKQVLPVLRFAPRRLPAPLDLHGAAG